ncbi:MAG: hypothetical protein IT429_21540 [Gemmataceae bacterium]|nr:hypothetical protein [Gemmataceae bacterium]
MSAPHNPWENQQQGNDFGELDSYGNEYRPQYVIATKTDSLPDGHYDCTIVSASMDRINADLVVRINLRTQDGSSVEWLHWLNKQPAVNGLCADLASLGFDSHLWNTPNRPLSREIPAAVAKLAGIKFRALKSSRPDNRPGKTGNVFHDFRAVGRIDGRPMPSLTPPVQPTVPNGVPPAAPVGAGREEDIPF